MESIEVAPTPFLRSLSIQLRVLRALLLREVITRFGRRNLGVLWLVLEPMTFTLGISALWTAAGLHEHSQIPIVAFAITGYSSVLMWRNVVGRCTTAIQQNLNLLYHRNVKVLDVFIARSLLEMIGATGSFAVLSAAFVWLEMIEMPVDPLLLVQGWIMLAWFGLSLGLVVGAATAYSEIVDRLWHSVAYLLFPLSGAAFMVDWLPAKAQAVVLMLPMVHGVEALRAGYFGQVVPTYQNLFFMGSVNLVLMFFGLILLRGAAKRAASE
jgi:capsular polysaccharide transport system permease protein